MASMMDNINRNMAKAFKKSHTAADISCPQKRSSRSLTSARSHRPKGLANPVSFVNTLNIAKTVLEANGVISLPSEIDEDCEVNEPIIDQDHICPVLSEVVQSSQPILRLGYDRTMELLAVFESEINIAYPCVVFEAVKKNLDQLFNTASASSSNQNTSHKDNYHELTLIDVDILKAIMAISLLNQGEDENTLAADLEDHLTWSVATHMSLERPEIGDVIMAVLLVQCPFRG